MMNNNGLRGRHWFAAKREADKWKDAVVSRAGPHKPEKPLVRYRLSITRRSSVEPDFDGVVRSAKHLVDGLKEAGIILDDKISNTGQWIVDWEKVAPKKGSMKIVVEEVAG